jgi:hypothetical protein
MTTTHKQYVDDARTRVAVLETNEKNIRETLIRIEQKIDKMDNRIWGNFYWTLAGFGSLSMLMVGGFSGLFAMMAHGFRWF